MHTRGPTQRSAQLASSLLLYLEVQCLSYRYKLYSYASTATSSSFCLEFAMGQGQQTKKQTVSNHQHDIAIYLFHSDKMLFSVSIQASPVFGVWGRLRARQTHISFLWTWPRFPEKACKIWTAAQEIMLMVLLVVCLLYRMHCNFSPEKRHTLPEMRGNLWGILASFIIMSQLLLARLLDE